MEKLHAKYAANTARFPALYGLLAEQLGVSAEAVAKAEIGFIPVDEWGRQAWALPERNISGKVVGIQERADNGRKFAVTGSKRGLAYMVDRDVKTPQTGTGWERVSKDLPCPLCGHPDGCMYPKGEYENPNAVICVTTETGATKSMGVGWLHIFDKTRYKLRRSNYSLLMPSEHPYLVVEGWSDVLAAYDLGFVAVGKSTAPMDNTSLTKLLAGCRVIIVGEHDAKAGKAGMEDSFDRLRRSCSECTKLMPPKGNKDLRHWVQNGLTHDAFLEYVQKHGDMAVKPVATVDIGTDVGNAELFVSEHKDTIRHNRTSNKWMNYDGQHWRADTGEDTAIRCYMQTAKEVYQKAVTCPNQTEAKQLLGRATYMQSAKGRSGALSYAKAMPPISVGQNDFDQDKFLLNCLDGTIDLRTGELRPHDPNDMITQIAPVHYRYQGRPKKPELWFSCLRRWHSDDEETIDYLQRLVGYCLTGDITSRVFPIFHGRGSNGKSVFLDTLCDMLGDYAGAAPKTLLTVSKNSEHSTEIADLYGKRLVVASETEENKKLKSALVKALTGDRYMKARFMRRDFFEFEQTAKVVLSTNHLPLVDDRSNSIWTRVHKVGWSVTIPEAEWDTHLIDKLKAEWTGILHWAIEGCLKWQQDDALIPTEAIRKQTEEYRHEQDPLPPFKQFCLEDAPDGGGIPADTLYAMWCWWCDREGAVKGKKGEFLRDLLLATPNATSDVDNEDGCRVIAGIKITEQAEKLFGRM